MSTYAGTLPGVFPWRATLTYHQASVIATMLSRPSGGGTPSSFALTADAPQGKANVWLSGVSLGRVRAMYPAMAKGFAEPDTAEQQARVAELLAADAALALDDDLTEG